jgi:chromate reductase, NAD(P)H dehydrogenase (quinone)
MTTIIGLCGSLRQRSFNRMLLRAAVDVAPRGTAIIPESIREIPLYDGDVEDEQGLPPPCSDSRTGSLKQTAY